MTRRPPPRLPALRRASADDAVALVDTLGDRPAARCAGFAAWYRLLSIVLDRSARMARARRDHWAAGDAYARSQRLAVLADIAEAEADLPPSRGGDAR